MLQLSGRTLDNLLPSHKTTESLTNNLEFIKIQEFSFIVVEVVDEDKNKHDPSTVEVLKIRGRLILTIQ